MTPPEMMVLDSPSPPIGDLPTQEDKKDTTQMGEILPPDMMVSAATARYDDAGPGT